MTILQPVPCPPDGGSGRDVESLLLCDIDGGEVVGTALAVYEYDATTGAPVGPPTFVDPVTGAPYVPVGTLQPCPGGSDCECGLTVGQLEALFPLPVDTQLTQPLTLAELLAQLPLLTDTQLTQPLTLAELLVLLPLPVDSDALTNLELRAADVIVDRPGDGMNLDQLAAIGQVIPGVPFVLTPTPGMSLRLWYLCADPDPDASNIGVITATLVGKGGIYQQYNIAHRQRFDGDVNGTLTIDVTAGTVQVTVHYVEF